MYTRFWQFRILTHRMVGKSHGRRGFPGADFAIHVPLYIQHEVDGADRGGDPMTAPAPEPVGEIAVAPYEADQLRRYQGYRIAVSETVQRRAAVIRADANRIDTDLEHARGRLASFRATIAAEDRPAWHPALSSRAYILLIALLVVAEVPIYASAFRFLRLPNWETYIIALFLSAAMIGLAKFTATTIASAPLSPAGGRSWTLALVINAVVLCLLLLVADFRADAMMAAAERGSRALTLAPTGMILALQLLGYMAGIVLTYLAIDHDIRRDQLTRSETAARTEVEKLLQQRRRLTQSHADMRARAANLLEWLVTQAGRSCLQYREGVLERWPDPKPPTYLTRDLPRGLFAPVPLGALLDAPPAQLAAPQARSAPARTPKDEGSEVSVPTLALVEGERP